MFQIGSLSHRQKQILWKGNCSHNLNICEEYISCVKFRNTFYLVKRTFQINKFLTIINALFFSIFLACSWGFTKNVDNQMFFPPPILFIIENMTMRGSEEQFLDTFFPRFGIIVVSTITLFPLIENKLLCTHMQLFNIK